MRHDNKHLGLEENEERRRERLDHLPQYEIVELSIGGAFIMQDRDAESGAYTASEQAKQAMARLGVADSGSKEM